MKMLTENLILRTLSVDDLDEVARMWNYPAGVTSEEAAEILKGMQENLKKNQPGAIYHFCLGVFEKNRHSDPPNRHCCGHCNTFPIAHSSVSHYILSYYDKNASETYRSV